MKDLSGGEMVIIGILAWLLWKEYNPEPVTLSTGGGANGSGAFGGGGAQCLPSGGPSVNEPLSSISGPAWTFRQELFTGNQE